MTVDASNALLRWYVVDKRPLPWRVQGEERPDPYCVWLSEIMLQQTTVAAVRPYFEKFAGRWPNVEALAAADEAEVMSAWAGLGYYARARNLAACARAVAASGGAFPDEEAELRKLPGIGRYTAAAIAAIAFGRRAVVVDSNVERVVARLFALKRELPAAREEIYGLASSITPEADCGDFAQAMMDLGATICTPRKPSCHACPLEGMCAARKEGEPQRYPLKAPRRGRPHKQGNAFWLQHDGHVLLVRRPAKGMLGGMLGLPTGPWGRDVPAGEGAPAAADWQEAGAVDHVFTHFALSMRLYCAQAETRDAQGSWWPVDRLSEAGLPTLFVKLAERGAAWQEAA
ncbi:MAG TPA: A/G-specific adenine glycosylase [Allosphingosinicella sp.]|jgi:A/G-specific adenine glycosylase